MNSTASHDHLSKEKQTRRMQEMAAADFAKQTDGRPVVCLTATQANENDNKIYIVTIIIEIPNEW